MNAQFDRIFDAVGEKLPMVAAHLDTTRADGAGVHQLRRRTNVVGISPHDRSARKAATMSYQLEVYCYSDEFPMAMFSDLLSTIRPSGPGLELRTQPDGWCMFNESVTVWIELKDIRPSNLWSSCAPGARWVVAVEANGDPLARWLQFAIPYYALGLLPDMAVHDCQRCELGLFTDPAGYRLFAISATSWRKMKYDMRERGYLDDEGLPVF